LSKIEVNTVEPQCGTTLTLGASGDTVTLGCGATAAGFGSTGEVSWDTTKKTSGFTAVSGVGYFCDTTSAAFTVTLPATPSAGNVVAVSDYNGTASTNNITVGRNSSNINGAADDYVISKSNSSVQFIYIDATVGWQTVFTGNTSDTQNPFIVATGGTVTCCGDYKIHTFTGPGTFTVSNAGTGFGANTVDYLVVAGGAGGGYNTGGGGGAGGYRESSGAASGCYTVSPLGASVAALPVTAQGYPITVGGGGTGAPVDNSAATAGNNSIFSTITSTGGGIGTNGPGSVPLAGTGGSGGGGSQCTGNPYGAGGAGNTPPVSPPQGNNGGNGNQGGAPVGYLGGGGGGATSVGANGSTSPRAGGNGGAGATSSINTTPTARAGGGGGGAGYAPATGGSATAGGGAGAAGCSVAGTPGTTNTGGGGGGGAAISSTPNPSAGGSGGSGIVIIRYKFQ